MSNSCLIGGAQSHFWNITQSNNRESEHVHSCLATRRFFLPTKSKRGCTRLQRILKLQTDKVSSLPQQTEDRAFAELQTPPLPASGQPIVRTAAANVNPNTNLTRTQEALLSPSERVIASRRQT